MKLLYQLGVILIISFIGEALHALLPLPVPASIYGLVLMLTLLMSKRIRLEQVKLAGDLLLEIMPPLFIPVSVGLITVWGDLAKRLIPILVITVVTTIIVMAVTGLVSQAVIRRQRKGEEE
ncbi:MAG: CidA/LrgA family protein, partial [Eubacteriales bacterium]|nr:CidA/LrgA family protein [Eubacteriales bacterium]